MAVFIDRKDDGVLRQIDVRPNEVRGFALEVEVIRLHLPLESIRLQAGTSPRASHVVMIDLQ